MASKQDILKVLTDAKALVEKGWTQGSYAKDERGRLVHVHSSNATCFCTLGAIRRAWVGARLFHVAVSVAKVFQKIIGRVDIGGWNDDEIRTQAEVVETFEKAIKYMEAQP